MNPGIEEFVIGSYSKLGRKSLLPFIPYNSLLETLRTPAARGSDHFFGQTIATIKQTADNFVLIKPIISELKRRANKRSKTSHSFFDLRGMRWAVAMCKMKSSVNPRRGFLSERKTKLSKKEE
jgi:hypothetical protein